MSRITPLDVQDSQLSNGISGSQIARRNLKKFASKPRWVKFHAIVLRAKSGNFHSFITNIPFELEHWNLHNIWARLHSFEWWRFHVYPSTDVEVMAFLIFQSLMFKFFKFVRLHMLRDIPLDLQDLQLSNDISKSRIAPGNREKLIKVEEIYMACFDMLAHKWHCIF